MSDRDSADSAAGDLERHNARRFIWANGLQNVGDQIVAAKTVLPWILSAAGAPAFIIGLLVPVREAGSMLPQAAITPWVLRQPSRSRVWIIGSVGQFLSALLMGVVSLFLRGWALGLSVLALMAAFALFRGLCSISSKDVQGRTISKGRRGLITGRATAIGGAMGLVTGIFLALYLDTGSPTRVLAALVIAASTTWLFASFIFAGIREPAGAADEADEADEAAPADVAAPRHWWSSGLELMREDRNFRTFVIVRSLMLVTALSTTFIVTLSAEAGQDVSAVGFFLIASGLASVLGGRISGIWSDRSSRNVMAGGALLASLTLILLVACARWAPQSVTLIAFPLAFFVVNLAHTAIRVARKTYVVDMASGDQRTRYVADANTIMGAVLLVVGAVSGAIAGVSTEAALLFLAVIGLIGVAFSRRLIDVSR